MVVEFDVGNEEETNGKRAKRRIGNLAKMFVSFTIFGTDDREKIGKDRKKKVFMARVQKERQKI